MKKKNFSSANTFSTTSTHARIVYDSNGQLSKNLSEHAQTNFQDTIESFISALRRKFTAFEYFMHQTPIGFLKNVRYGNLIKICILGIIMFMILRGTFAIDLKPITFASTNTIEKTPERRLAKKVSNTTSSVQPSNISFDLSPASVHELSPSTVSDYVKRYSPIAVNEMDRSKVPASISMAQAIIESRAGTSVLSVRNNNHFGIKCFSRTCPKGHCSNYTDDHHKDFFRIYKSAPDSWQEHTRFISQNRYRNLLKYGKNYRAWARGLRDLGYATDANYDAKLISIIEKYKLYTLDDL